MRRCLHVLLLLALLCSAGCASLPFRVPFTGRGADRGLSQEELSIELDAYSTRFTGLVSTAAEEIASATNDSAVRRRALLWNQRLPPAVNEAAFLGNPQRSYVRVLTIAVMMKQYLTTGDGRDLFGPSQAVAMDVSTLLATDALAIGSRFLTPPELEGVRKEVEDLAARFPIQGTQFSLVRARQAVQAVPTSNALTYVISLPLAPFRALQGVDSDAAAIRDFNQTARRFATIAAALPETLRAEMQLLLLDAEDLRAVRQGLSSFELAAASAERASLAMERLPDDLRSVLDREIRSMLADSENTVGQAAQAVGHASEAVAQARELAGPLQETATQLREASGLWREILGPRRPPRPDDRPFDVREWESAARTIGATAAEMRGLTAAVHDLSADAGLDGLFLRGVALIVVFFAVLLLYRVLSARWVGRG